MTTGIQPISREAEELLELAEWDAHLAYDFACKGLVVAHAEDRARYQRVIDELARLSASVGNGHIRTHPADRPGPRAGGRVARFRKLLAELDYAQRRMFEIRTGGRNLLNGL